MKFTKMHGIGNDYVYVDGFSERVANPVALAQQVSDRHFGIGGDGLILILPSERADVRMQMFNADGSEAEMCGNGVRCVAKYAYDHGLTRSNPMKVETGRGVLTLDLEVRRGNAAAFSSTGPTCSNGTAFTSVQYSTTCGLPIETHVTSGTSPDVSNHAGTDGHRFNFASGYFTTLGPGSVVGIFSASRIGSPMFTVTSRALPSTTFSASVSTPRPVSTRIGLCRVRPWS